MPPQRSRYRPVLQLIVGSHKAERKICTAMDSLMNQATAKSSLEKHSDPPCKATTFVNNRGLGFSVKIKYNLMKDNRVQQTSHPDFRKKLKKKKNSNFKIKACEWCYLNSSELDVV